MNGCRNLGSNGLDALPLEVFDSLTALKFLSVGKTV